MNVVFKIGIFLYCFVYLFSSRRMWHEIINLFSVGENFYSGIVLIYLLSIFTQILKKKRQLS